jgi:DNA repair exonuclease SbcCD ATPase subunit
MWSLDITNIGGIRAADVTITEGLNVVQASNFMGKSSFISAMQVAMGTTGMFGEAHPLMEGADEGATQLEIEDGGNLDVRLDRSHSNTISRHGSPFLADEMNRTCARLFAFLGESNPIRSRVRNGEHLTDLLQTPLDIENIDTEIASRKRKRESVTRQLREAEQAVENIPSVQEAVQQLETDLEQLRARRQEVSERVAQEGSASGGLSDELADRRSRLQTTNQTISRLQNRRLRTEERLADAREELSSLDVPDAPEVSADIEQTEDRIADLEMKIDLLESLHRVNQRVIEEGEVELVAAIDRNFIADEFDCWVCGEPTTAENVQSRLETLREKIPSLREEKSTLKDELSEVKRKQNQYQKEREKKAELQETIGSLKADIDEIGGDIQQAKDRKQELADEIEQLEEELATADEQLSEELTDIKAEIRTKETELTEQRSRLSTLREKRDETDELREKKERLSDEITALRNRKTEKQWEIKDQFDSAIEAAVDQFAPGFDGAHLNVKTSQENEIEEFELIIARDGRETDITNLSEGERELVGIVVAVAGYRAFDVAERVPVILLDGISQLSADNLRRLTEYLADASEILVTTAYPEAGEFDGHSISPAEWVTVSDEDVPTV